MVDFYRPPTKDEMQYASDVIHGKRKVDILVIAIAAITGALFGVIIGFSGAEANNEAPDPGFILLCAGICAFALGIIAMLIMAALRSILAVCKAWLPARIITIVACVVLVIQILRKLQFWFIFPSQVIMDIALGSLLLVFALLFFNLGLRLIFIIYCMITGKDEDEIMVRNISAKNNKNKR